jgi:hypothetical protein
MTHLYLQRMTDVCWLPSAIMQTTGALLGIYAVIYVLGAQFLAKEKEFYMPFSKGPIKEPVTPLRTIILFDSVFYVVVVISLLTIYFNYLWLADLTVGVAEPKVPIDIVARGLFKAFLFGIGAYTVILITFYRIPLKKWRGKKVSK